MTKIDAKHVVRIRCNQLGLLFGFWLTSSVIGHAAILWDFSADGIDLSDGGGKNISIQLVTGGEYSDTQSPGGDIDFTGTGINFIRIDSENVTTVGELPLVETAFATSFRWSRAEQQLLSNGGVVGNAIDFISATFNLSYSQSEQELSFGTGSSRFGFSTLSNVSFAPVPEPNACLSLIGAGLVGFSVWNRRQKKREQLSGRH